MQIKGIIDEDFVNYKLPSMHICTCYCDFKCDRESGVSCCQNSSLATLPAICVPDDTIIRRYLSNPITKAICFAGLEPFDQFLELYGFIRKLRLDYHCDDAVVIYTGYNEDEITTYLNELQEFQNIIVKFGRFVPNLEKRYDDVLGIWLASGNQYAREI